MNETLTVSELNNNIKRNLEENFSQINLTGEISNFKKHISGHWYFSLKDSQSQINCTMWKGINNYVFFTPQDGMKVNVTGRVTLYPPRGSYQFDVRSMRTAGIGELQEAFERLKRELNNAGYFNEEYKKEIPQFPKRIGIVTAIGAAALRDMISVAQRRFPIAELVLRPAKVQGEGAAIDIAKGILELNKNKNVDVIIIGRGGGSLEDLWAFNERIVAEEIFSSKIPIISGVGHEVDFTISDYVADMRAPTPTAAMELATPNIIDIFAFIRDFSYNTKADINSKMKNAYKQLNNVLNSYGYKNPFNLIRKRQQQLDGFLYKIQKNEKIIFESYKNRIKLLEKSVVANNLEHILKKGFSLIKQNSKYVTRAKDFDEKEIAEIQFYDNKIEINKD